MKFYFGDDYMITIEDDTYWRDMLDSKAKELFEEAGVEPKGERFDDFKYDKLEYELMGAIQDALDDATHDERLLFRHFNEYFDGIRG
jgi:hypothetical protein